MRPEALVLGLVRAALEGGLLMGMAWAATRLWPGLPAAARALLWWWVCARLLVSLLPLAPLNVEVLPAPAPPSVEAPRTSPVPALRALPGAIGLPALDGEVVESPPTTPRRSGGAQGDAWLSIAAWALLALWGGGTAWRLVGLVRQSLHARRLAHDARPLIWSRLATRVRDPFQVAVSDRIRVPLATGLLRPRILIPSPMLRRGAEELTLALAHERAHLRRGDLWMAWVPALADAVFWFHPLARVATREYAQACEEACDEDALRVTGISPYRYGRLLLTFGVERPLAGAAAMPLGSPHAEQLRRRLTMLQHTVARSRTSRFVALAVVGILAALALTPVHVVPTVAQPRESQDAQPSSAVAAMVESPCTPVPAPPDVPPAPDDPAPPAAEDAWFEEEAPGELAPGYQPLPRVVFAPRATPHARVPRAPRPPRAAAVSPLARSARAARSAPAARTPRAWWGVGVPAVPAIPSVPVVPAPPALSYSPTPVPSSPTPRARKGGYSYHAFDDDSGTSGFAYALVSGDGESSGSGRTHDWRDIQRLRQTLDGDFFWARIDRKRFVTQDPEVIARIVEIFAPQRELGEQQSRLGDQQSLLGDRQSEIGDRQSELGDRQAQLAELQAQLAEDHAQGASEARRREWARRQQELSDAQGELGSRQEELGRQQEGLGRQQEALGRRQELLGREMARLSRQIQADLKAVVEEAVRDGRASPLP